MRVFYVFWFAFCSLWGYLVAGSSGGASYLTLLAALPLAVLCFTVMFALELRRRPDGQQASIPSLRLPPWDLPTGMAVFGAMTFSFVAFWGLALSLALGYGGTRLALQIGGFAFASWLSMFICLRLMPQRFKTPHPTQSG